MVNNEVINGLVAITSVSNAYQSIKKDVLDSAGMERAACVFVENLCAENASLCSASSLNNGSDKAGIAFGAIRIPLDATDAILSVLRQKIPQLIQGNTLSIDAKLDFAKAFSILISVDRGEEAAATICQKLLLSMIGANNSLHFHCADLVMGGNFFSSVHKLITLFPSRTGGKVYTKANEFSELIKSLENSASIAMTKLGGTYASVEEYNKQNEVKIDEHLTIVYLGATSYHNEDYNRLRILLENGKRNGMSFIIVGSGDATDIFSNHIDFQLGFNNSRTYIGKKAKLPFDICFSGDLSEAVVENLIATLQTAETIDTRYENHPNLHSEFFTMDSGAALRIPFAIDKNNTPLYFEIGGNAPTHALIAGSTGSGKSVALHTLIMQIIHNYHPDDVEIWAIDYKAVEFARYLDHRSPHFRVIAHDTSNEFSLSLIDLLYKEYEKRQQEFLSAKVKNINEYRRVRGKHSMPRIIAIIDEFQLMTQAVQEYTGNVDYRTRLENLLRLTRAMGISFVLCSQTIASGLSGLSDAARDQIGCRLCLKHDDDNEIRETLMLSGPNASDVAGKAKELRRGQGIYKRARWANEHDPDGKAYEFLHAHILFINDDLKTEMINTANRLLGNNFTPKEEILIRGGGRICISEKVRHPLVRFMNEGYEPDDECIEWYPAAPTTLADSFCLEVENSAAANIMLVGEDDDLRESTVVHSVCGFLMNPNNRVVVSIVDENYPDRARMIDFLRKIQSAQLILNIGIRSTLDTIAGLKKIRPTPGRNTIYIWYGLDKLKNELFLMSQDEDEEATPEVKPAPASREDLMADLMGFLTDITENTSTVSKEVSVSDSLTFDDCKNILRQAFEVGPENNKLHMIIFNNRKAMKKSGFIDMDNFENRIGTRMSTDDSYELFGSSLAISKTDENTVIYYAGSGSVIPLRPYLMPDDNWFRLFNEAISNL